MERRENLQCLHHGILEVPQEGRVVQHSVAGEALRVPCKLLLSKHVVVLSQGKRGDVDALEHFAVEITAPVHQRLGENKGGKVALQKNLQKRAENLVQDKC